MYARSAKRRFLKQSGVTMERFLDARALPGARRVDYEGIPRMKEPLSTPNAPAALGPYSQGVAAGGLLFSSGQLGIVPATGELVGDDVAAQVEQAIDNIEAILATDGLTLADVVKTTVYLRHMTDFAAMNEVYARRFPAPFPARSAVEVGPLAKNALVEIEVVALRR